MFKVIDQRVSRYSLYRNDSHLNSQFSLFLYLSGYGIVACEATPPPPLSVEAIESYIRHKSSLV